jgi:hypothetical protein
VDQRVLELMVENLGVFRSGEVALLPPGLDVDADDPVDELLEAPLALRGAHRTAEVLAGDDVRRVEGPEVGELDAALLEVDRAVAPVRHHDITALPGDLVVRVHPVLGVDALEAEALPCLPAATRFRPARRLRHVVPPSGSVWIPVGLTGPCC